MCHDQADLVRSQVGIRQRELDGSGDSVAIGSDIQDPGRLGGATRAKVLGQDRSFPLVLSGNWRPNRKIWLNLFAGIEFGGRLKLKDEDGDTLIESDYDPAAVFGGTFEFRF